MLLNNLLHSIKYGDLWNLPQPYFIYYPKTFHGGSLFAIAVGRDGDDALQVFVNLNGKWESQCWVGNCHCGGWFYLDDDFEGLWSCKLCGAYDE